MEEAAGADAVTEILRCAAHKNSLRPLAAVRLAGMRQPPHERLARNQKMCSTCQSRTEDTIKLSVPFDEIRPDTFTGAEIRSIQSDGYQRVDDFTFIPPK